MSKNNLPEKFRIHKLISWTCCIELKGLDLLECCFENWRDSSSLSKSFSPEKMIFEILKHDDLSLAAATLWDDYIETPSFFQQPFNIRIGKKRILKKIEPGLNKSIDLRSIIDRAKKDGQILPEHLAVIMAYEDYHPYDLNKLLMIYIDNKDEAFQQKINTDTPDGRIAVWYHLFYRWMGYHGLRLGSGDDIIEAEQLRPSDLHTCAPYTEFITLLAFRDYIRTKINPQNEIEIPLPGCLFPEKVGAVNAEQVEKKEQDASLVETQIDFKHSPDYRSVIIQEQTFTLTPNQAHVIKLLHEAYKNKPRDLGQDYILEEIGSPSSRLRSIFRSTAGACEALIAKGEKKGTVRLKI